MLRRGMFPSVLLLTVLLFTVAHALADALYWTSMNGTITRYDLATGLIDTYAVGGCPRALTVYRKEVFYTDTCENAVFKLTWPGRRRVKLVAGLPSLAGCLVKDNKLFFNQQGAGNGLWSAELDGSGLTPVLMGLSNTVELAAAPDGICLTIHGTEGKVLHYSETTGLQEILSRQTGEVFDPMAVLCLPGMLLVSDLTQKHVIQHTLWDARTRELLSLPTENVGGMVLVGNTLFYAGFHTDQIWKFDLLTGALESIASCGGADCYGIALEVASPQQ